VKFTLVTGEPTENVHMAFAGDRNAVHAFHEAALAAGFRDNGAPGERPEYHAGYYAAFVLDPDGNNVEVVDHGR
jgi:catechol 2,3-dioxygenase-like lactoylglutathione lyase family enzyme